MIDLILGGMVLFAVYCTYRANLVLGLVMTGVILLPLLGV